MATECEQGSFGQVAIPPNLKFRGVLLDPRLGEETIAHVRRGIAEVWREGEGVVVATSGTSRREGQAYTFVHLSIDALTSSAHGVNLHLGALPSDVWLLSLPDFHVGGLGIHIRAALAGARVVRSVGNIAPWRVEDFLRDLHGSRATLLSLVPTQLYDLLRMGAKAPEHLRAVVIGGGAVSLSEYLAGRALGWPLLPSYGCTEACSQIATAPLASLDGESTQLPKLQVLSHWQVRTRDSTLEIAGPALLTNYFELRSGVFSVRSPLVDGWYQTGDLVDLDSEGSLVMVGRRGDLVKVGGEGVSLQDLSLLLRDLRRTTSLPGDAVVSAEPDARLGTKIVLYTTTQELGAFLEREINANVLPYARIREVVRVPEVPTTALGKPRLGDIRRV